MANRLSAWLNERLLSRKGTLGRGTSAPLPNRYTQGRFPEWSSMLAAYAAQFQPIAPDEAREGRDNPIVNTCIAFINTNWHKATPRVGIMRGDKFEPIEGTHWLTDMLANPAIDMGKVQFMSALIRDFIVKGDCYAHKLRNNVGTVVALEYIPARFIRKLPDPETGRLSFYRYTPYGMQIDFDREDIINIQCDVDPDFPLNGMSRLSSLYREIVTDNSYSDYAAGLARNGGIPPIVFTPRAVGDGTVLLDAEDAKDLSDALNDKFRSEPGRTRVLPGALEMHKTGTNPNEMALTDVRAMPETRIPAALGLNALALQLYTGVQRSTFTNMVEARIACWEQCIIPMMATFAEAWTRSLLWEDKQSKARGLVVRYDTSEVDELSDDLIALRDAARADVLAGILTVDEARAIQGYAPDATLNAPPLSPIEPIAPKRAPILRATKSAPQDIYSVADAYRRRLARDEQDAIDEMATEWAKAISEAQARLAAMLASMDESDTVDARVLIASERLSEIIPQMQDKLAQLSERGAAIIENGQRAMIATSVHSQSLLAKAQGISQWNTLPVESFEALVGLSSNGSPLSDLLDEAFADFASNVRSQLLSGIAQGMNPTQVGGMISALTGTSRARTETIARTEMLRANREASRRTYAANRDVLEGWVRLSAADADTCAACWALHGTKQMIEDVMPSHPNCRCVTVPVPKAPTDGPDTRTKIPLGEDIFAALPESEQMQILGPGRFEQWRNGQPFSSFAVVSSSEYGPTVQERRVSDPAREGFV